MPLKSNMMNVDFNPSPQSASPSELLILTWPNCCRQIILMHMRVLLMCFVLTENWKLFKISLKWLISGHYTYFSKANLVVTLHYFVISSITLFFKSLFWVCDSWCSGAKYETLIWSITLHLMQEVLAVGVSVAPWKHVRPPALPIMW